MKRKRPRHAELKARKRIKGREESPEAQHPSYGVLQVNYPVVQSLRQYLAVRVSKRRRTFIEQYGRSSSSVDEKTTPHEDLIHLLDSTTVGSFGNHSPQAECPKNLSEQLRSFTQRRSESISSAGTSSQALSFVNIVDYCVWLLFKRHETIQHPPHILCHGYVRGSTGQRHDLPPSAGCEIEGLIANHPNPYVARLRRRPWVLLPELLGQKSECVLIDLLTNCGIFSVLESDQKNWIQLSGTPLPDLPPRSEITPKVLEGQEVQTRSPEAGRLHRPLNSIRFVRHRMLYGKPILNARSGVSFGQRRIHALNRYHSISDDFEAVHLMKYVFPREFGLHNVFTSNVSKEESAQPFLDYTLRDNEITKQDMTFMRKPANQGGTFAAKRKRHLPKRLRGRPFELVRAIRKRHGSCPYRTLMNHYCPATSRPTNEGATDHSDRIFDLATPIPQVSAFCRAVINRIIPSECWGSSLNKHHILISIDIFISLRRYETTSLHAVTQSLSYTSLAWLSPLAPNKSLSSTLKTCSLFNEFLYYIFDSLLLPLLSTNFYITESGTSRNRLLFFRQDVWASIATPTLTRLRDSMFELVPPAEKRRVTSNGALGTSRVRLLPKENGLRPIVNLRRRGMVKGDGRMVLGKSVNSSMRPAFAVLNYEKRCRPGLVGCSIFSVDELGPRLGRFKEGLVARGWRPGDGGLYFVKVDVKGCFDSIPQEKLLGLLREVLRRGRYTIGRHAVGKLVKGGAEGRDRMAWKFNVEAKGSEEAALLQNLPAEANEERCDRVVVDKVVRRTESRIKVLETLEEHVGRNMVGIGKGLYRQKVGIAQGSVASSLLCSLFYGSLDHTHLGFLAEEGQRGEALMVRLIDDFLLVTTRLHVAKRFVGVMHQGIPEFGLQVKREKSRSSFPMFVDGQEIGTAGQQSLFAYCGLAIDTATLSIGLDDERRARQDLKTAVTVEHAKSRGKSFYRKVLDMAKLHMHGMLLSTKLNDETTVLDNLGPAFIDMAWRIIHYLNGIKSKENVSQEMVIRTIDDLIDFAFAMMKKKRGKDSSECTVSRRQHARVAYEALLKVFQRRQTKLRLVVEWMAMRLAGVADAGAKKA